MVLIFSASVAVWPGLDWGAGQSSNDSSSWRGLVAKSPDWTSHVCSSGEIQAGWWYSGLVLGSNAASRSTSTSSCGDEMLVASVQSLLGGGV